MLPNGRTYCRLPFFYYKNKWNYRRLVTSACFWVLNDSTPWNILYKKGAYLLVTYLCFYCSLQACLLGKKRKKYISNKNCDSLTLYVPIPQNGQTSVGSYRVKKHLTHCLSYQSFKYEAHLVSCWIIVN